MCFEVVYFYIGFISSKYTAFFLGILVNKRIDADSGSLVVIGYLLVGNADAVKVF